MTLPTALVLLTVAQPLSLEAVAAALDKGEAVTLAGGTVRVEAADFTHTGDTVEAVAVRPTAAGRHPGVLLIPGYGRTARDQLPLAVRLAREGVATLAVTQRGFGKSAGKPDFVGPQTLAALEEGYRRLRAADHIDAARVGLCGYSRGAMAAALLSVRPAFAELKGAVFAAGVYDFRAAYDAITAPAIRANMEAEAGLSAEAVAARTATDKMATLPCPVLILHGEKDVNTPVAQAQQLAAKLTELKKPHELVVLADRDHDLGRQAFNDRVAGFFAKAFAPDKP